MRYINDDYQIKHGGRKATKNSITTTQNAILKMLQRMHRSLPNVQPTVDEFTDANGNITDESILELLIELPSVRLQKDMKIHTEIENATISNKGLYGGNLQGTPLVGWHTLPNGLTFLGFQAGADWDEPYFGIIYFDGTQIRIYIPTYGNPYNRVTMQTLGYDDPAADAKFLAKYGMTMNSPNIGFQWDAILSDITARIIVV